MRESILDYKGAFSDKKYCGIPRRKHPFQDTEDPLPINPFVGDEAKIVNSKAFRRLTGKPQVFPNPSNPYVRNRQSHSYEALSIGAVISDFLGLNTDLCRAGLLGHDIGHVPFGHHGEEVITDLSAENGKKKVFNHAVYGVVVAQKIERKDEISLNLTYPTLQCMLNHSRKGHELAVNPKLSLECAVVMYADKLSYTFADINDAVRMGRLRIHDLPEVFDFSKSHRVLTTQCITELVKESTEAGVISFQKSETAQAFLELREWMYKNVYHEINWDLQEAVLKKDFEFFAEDQRFKDIDPLIMLTLLTDSQALCLADAIRSNRPVGDYVIEESGIFEMKKYILGKKIDYCNPDLDEEDFLY
ncbi:MAG: HD domain-containing protein [Nanoarchaeota archaeon]|nr:HD domain-containing protein [Nanoarchaeota archaeon]MBU1632856.1 HD domain-containing protein [Nanoarchaeota archaeon]MBU1876136.1 HD domain-containing protein [Nanoarchaeota archaeon]